MGQSKKSEIINDWDLIIRMLDDWRTLVDILSIQIHCNNFDTFRVEVTKI